MTVATSKSNLVVLDSKSLRLVKKMRKLARRLRKRAIKVEDTTTLMHANESIEVFDKIITDHKNAVVTAQDNADLVKMKKDEKKANKKQK